MQLRRQLTVSCTPSGDIWWQIVVLHKVNLTFWRMQLRRQWTVGSGQSDVPPCEEGSSGQEQYYIRSMWHSEKCNWEGSLQSDVPPSGDIWWPWAVQHKGQADILKNAIEKAVDSQMWKLWFVNLKGPLKDCWYLRPLWCGDIKSLQVREGMWSKDFQLFGWVLLNLSYSKWDIPNLPKLWKFRPSTCLYL